MKNLQIKKNKILFQKIWCSQKQYISLNHKCRNSVKRAAKTSFNLFFTHTQIIFLNTLLECMQAIEIAVQYDTLLRIGVSHTFFGEDKPEIFTWQASPETVSLLNQMGILIRYNDDGVVLLASSAEESSLRKKIQEAPTFTLSFAIYAENPYFTHFTNLPLEEKGKCFYFTNAQNKNNTLHATEYATASDRLPVVAGKYMMSEQKVGSVYTLAHHTLPAHEELTADALGQVTADLSRLPFGKYTLSSKSKTEATFLYTAHAPSKTFVGWADIVIDEKTSLMWINELAKGTKIKPQAYQIKFESRKTFWKYYFISKYLPNLDHAEIEITGNTLQFEKAQEVLLPNGTKATCFEAKQALPLKKKPNLNMQLIRKKDAKGNNIRQILCKVPAPNYEGLKAESRQIDAKVFSEVIIYV